MNFAVVAIVTCLTQTDMFYRILNYYSNNFYNLNITDICSPSFELIFIDFAVFLFLPLIMYILVLKLI